MKEIPLRQRAFEVLTYLVRNSGRLVSKQELFESIWGGVAVTDDSLVQCLVDIRKALGSEQERVRTIRGRGYVFEGAVPQDLQRSIPAALLLAGMTIVGAGAWLVGRSRGVPAVSTLAVLPFVQTSAGDPSNLGDGLHEDVVSALGQIDPEPSRSRSGNGYRRLKRSGRGRCRLRARFGGLENQAALFQAERRPRNATRAHGAMHVTPSFRPRR